VPEKYEARMSAKPLASHVIGLKSGKSVRMLGMKVHLLRMKQSL
jgi:hypothetical protein